MNATNGTPDPMVDVLNELEFVLLTIEHRPGLSRRVDLFTMDERNRVRRVIARARGEEFTPSPLP